MTTRQTIAQSAIRHHSRIMLADWPVHVTKPQSAKGDLRLEFGRVVPGMAFVTEPRCGQYLTNTGLGGVPGM